MSKDVTHNTCCCISPEAEREAYIRGAKDALAEVHTRARRIAGTRNAVYSDFGAAVLELEYDVLHGEWPKGE